jgi:hypothetical protein
VNYEEAELGRGAEKRRKKSVRKKRDCEREENG